MRRLFVPLTLLLLAAAPMHRMESKPHPNQVLSGAGDREIGLTPRAEARPYTARAPRAP